MSSPHAHRAHLSGAADGAPALVFAIMLSSVMIMPAVRPLLAARGASESAMHAFLSVAMLGAAVGAPLVAAASDRGLDRHRVLIALVAIDAAAALACLLPLPVPAMLVVRAIQGAANVGALSIAMSVAGAPHAARGATAARGAAMMLALVAGAPTGGLLLSYGHVAPFVGASVALVGGLAAFTLVTPSRGSEAPLASAPSARVDWRTLSASPAMRIAAALAFVERFTVGCFVVTFAVHAHGSLGWSDQRVSLAYAAMLVPFALATYPIARMGSGLSRLTSIVVGCLLYAVAFASFGVLHGAALFAALGVAGIGSALLYAPALCFAAAVPSRSRATAMAAFHAAGCLGMMLGPAAAGILSAALRHAEVAPDARHASVFALGAVSVVLVLALLRPALRRVATSTVYADGCQAALPHSKGESQ